MKKCMRGLALLLAVLMLMTSTVLAAGIESDKAIIRDQATGATVTFNETNSEKIDVVYTAENLTVGAQYLILMVKSDKDGNYGDITEGSILYIDQQPAVAGEGEAAPSITFSAYPSAIETSVILITGVEGAENGRIKAAIVEGKYILGDVDEDGEVTISDAVALLRWLVKLTDEINMNAADTDGSGEVNISDAVKLLRVLVKLETLE